MCCYGSDIVHSYCFLYVTVVTRNCSFSVSLVQGSWWDYENLSPTITRVGGVSKCGLDIKHILPSNQPILGTDPHVALKKNKYSLRCLTSDLMLFDSL